MVTKHLLVNESETKMTYGIQMRSLSTMANLENFILEVGKD